MLHLISPGGSDFCISVLENTLQALCIKFYKNVVIPLPLPFFLTRTDVQGLVLLPDVADELWQGVGPVTGALRAGGLHFRRKREEGEAWRDQ